MAMGAADIYLRFPPPSYEEKIWDHAAGSVIVEEAGGRCSDAVGKKLDFGAGRTFSTINGGIIASPPQMQAALLDAAIATASR